MTEADPIPLVAVDLKCFRLCFTLIFVDKTNKIYVDLSTNKINKMNNISTNTLITKSSLSVMETKQKKKRQQIFKCFVQHLKINGKICKVRIWV